MLSGSTELLHHIVYRPAFDYFATTAPKHFPYLPIDQFPRWSHGDSLDFFFVGTLYRSTDAHFVPFSYNGLNGAMTVGDGFQDLSKVLYRCLPAYPAQAGTMVGKVYCQYLIKKLQIPLV